MKLTLILKSIVPLLVEADFSEVDDNHNAEFLDLLN